MTQGEIKSLTKLDWERELEKCKSSMYYFATTYLKVNEKPFTTLLSEEDFNNTFKHTFHND